MTEPAERWQFFIEGQTPTKKNRRPIFRGPGGRPFLGKDKELRDWEKKAVWQLKSQHQRLVLPPITGPLNLKAEIYWRYRGSGRKADLSNLIQSVEDALQEAGVIRDDSQFEGFDGSRRICVKENPCVRIVLERFRPDA